MRSVLPLMLLAGCGSAPGTGGGGIVSTNPCSDAMLVRLVAPSRIAAISAFSQQPGATSIPLALARRFRAIAGTAEEVVALRPDLVIASSFASPATRDAYARAGLRTLYLDSPQTIAASEAQVRAVAAAVGEPGRGAMIVRGIEGALRRYAVAAHRRGGDSRPSALLYIAGDLATGPGTLLDDLLRRAGFADAAARYGLAHTGTLSAERIVADPPDVIIGGGPGSAVRRALMPQVEQVPFDRSLVNCAGPTIPRAMRRLAAIRADLL